MALNVGALPEALVESTLFGHERGAFPGAETAREGLFRAASGGTLFLDEVGELPVAVQAKLLRAVETKEILPLGADRGLEVDTRIVASTQADLAERVEDGTFRRDLMYRLQVVELRLPPLRDRRGDIAGLAAHFAETHARTQRKGVREIAPDAMAVLTSYSWPGNVRELSNVIERAVILAADDTITPMELPGELGVTSPAAEVDDEPRAAEIPASPALSDAACNLDGAVVAFQRRHIARVLDRARGNRETAARLLGLSPATFYRYLQRVGLKGYALEEDRCPK